MLATSTEVREKLARGRVNKRPRGVFSKSLRVPPRTLETVLGIVVALLACEFALRPFAAGLPNLPFPSKDYRPSNNFSAPSLESRQYLEGFAVSHFAPDGARLTGQQWLGAAPVGLILGDSYIEAAQVDDLATLGAVFERLSRSQGKPFNIRQYGWRGAGIPTYLAVADRMQSEWHPSWVAFILNRGDLGTQGLKGGLYYYMKIQSDESYQLIEIDRTATKVEALLGRAGLSAYDVRRSMEASTLAFLSVQRLQLIATNSRAQQPAPAKSAVEIQSEAKERTEDEVATRVYIRALKTAYGDHLLIIYLPNIDLAANNEPDETERELLEVCREMRVTCSSMREAMLHERDNNHRLARGFSNTTLGEGHLNEDGHRLVGTEIWRLVSSFDERVNGK